MFVVDDPAMNAFAYGSGTSALVVYTTGLLDELDDAQLDAVTAHEMAHIANRDTRLGSLCAALFLWTAMLSTLVWYVRIRALVSGRWTDATIITIHLS